MLQVLKLRIHKAKGNRQSNNAECCAKHDDGVADIIEVEILNGACAEDNEENNEDSAVKAVVKVGEGGGLHLDEASGGHGSSQNHK